MWFRHFRIAALLFLVLMGITGLLYPLAVTELSALIFSDPAGGSLLQKGGRLVGSRLVGQPFDDPRYFWGRPSATSPFPYNATSSSGSNLGPTNEALKKAVSDRIASLKAADPENKLPVPADLVFASGSGLDPHITPAAALYQAHRVARSRHLNEDAIRALVEQHTEGRQLGLLGEPRVNVLELNLALDAMNP